MADQPTEPAAPTADTAVGQGSPVILEARDLRKSFTMAGEAVEVLHGVSLRVTAGEFVAIMGPSGSGKSTLIQLLGGLDSPTGGEVVLDGVDIGRASDDEATRIRRERTGFVFQSFNLVPLLTVAENVGLPYTLAGVDPRKGEAAARVREAIALVELTGKERYRPDLLSAGEQQRVAIARALLLRPALVFADEPTGNLDYTTGLDILGALWRACVDRGQTIVLVTHDAKAAAFADRVLFVQDGAVREEIVLGRRDDHSAAPLIARLSALGL